MERGSIQGSAVLLIRQEVVSLTDPQSPSADVIGKVYSVSRNGPLASIAVTTKAGTITIESGTVSDVLTGDLVGLVLPISRRVILANESGKELPTSFS